MTSRQACIVAATLCCFLAVAGSPRHAFAELTANTWRRQTDAVRSAFVAGVVDTWSYFDANLANYKSLHPEYRSSEVDLYFEFPVSCLRERQMPYAQVLAIVEAYTEGHPEVWDRSMTSITWRAIFEACKAVPPGPKGK
jgi:hypothetical protein